MHHIVFQKHQSGPNLTLFYQKKTKKLLNQKVLTFYHQSHTCLQNHKMPLIKTDQIIHGVSFVFCSEAHKHSSSVRGKYILIKPLSCNLNFILMNFLLRERAKQRAGGQKGGRKKQGYGGGADRIFMIVIFVIIQNGGVGG